MSKFPTHAKLALTTLAISNQETNVTCKLSLDILNPSRKEYKPCRAGLPIPTLFTILRRSRMMCRPPGKTVATLAEFNRSY